MREFLYFLTNRNKFVARILLAIIVLCVLVLMSSCQGCSHSGRRAMLKEQGVLNQADVNETVLLDYNQAYVQTSDGSIKLAYCDYCEQYLDRLFKNRTTNGDSIRISWLYGKGLPVYIVENDYYILNDTLDTYNAAYVLSFEHGEEREVKLWDDRPDQDIYYNGWIIGFKLKDQ